MNKLRPVGGSLPLLATAVGFFQAFALGAAPSLTVQEVAQDPDTAVVTVSYKLADEPAVVTVDIQTNAGGNVWASIGGAHQQHWAGDVNRLVAPSDEKVRKATWIADVDWPGFVLDGSKARAVVKVWPQDDPPDYMVVDGTAPTNVCYYAGEEFLPLGVTNRLYKTDCYLLRRIHAANVVWLMGSPTSEKGRGTASNEGLHPVKLTADYYLGVYPVTQFQWKRVTNKNQSVFLSGNDPLLHPIENVTWGAVRGGDWVADGHDNLSASSFMSVLRKRTGVKFDLPTSAQWEYACRAGTMSSLYTGESPSYTAIDGGDYSEETDAIAWNYHNNATDPDCVTNSQGFTTHIVGKKPANPWGLYDMLGNTWDMCLDWYATDVPVSTELQVDPTGPAQAMSSGDLRGHVWRGGDSAVHRAGSYLRAARNYTYGDNSSTFGCLGFRLSCPVSAIGCFVNEGGAQ